MDRSTVTCVRRSSALILFGLTAGCGLLDPDEEERAMPGILGVFPSQVILIAEPARAGEQLVVTVVTEARGCPNYIVTGPHQTLVTAEGMDVEIRPFDLVRRSRLPPGAACVDVLVEFHHEVTLVPPEAGTMTVRAVGRRLATDESPRSPGEPVTLEVSATVEPRADGT